MRVNIHEAKTNLSRLVDRAAAGEEIVIVRAGRPVARLVAYQSSRKRRQLGLYAGEPFEIVEDFDELPQNIALAFEGEREK
jgi:prevent-host-death family protein